MTIWQDNKSQEEENVADSSRQCLHLGLWLTKKIIKRTHTVVLSPLQHYFKMILCNLLFHGFGISAGKCTVYLLGKLIFVVTFFQVAIELEYAKSMFDLHKKSHPNDEILGW